MVAQGLITLRPHAGQEINSFSRFPAFGERKRAKEEPHQKEEQEEENKLIGPGSSFVQRGDWKICRAREISFSAFLFSPQVPF